MAFVFSEPRFVAHESCSTPGPGSHCPDLVQTPMNKANQIKKYFRKGKAFTKSSQNQQSPTPIQSVIGTDLVDHSRQKVENRQTKPIKKSDLSNYGITESKNTSNSQAKFLQISSLQRGMIFLDIKKDMSEEKIDESSLGNFQNIDMKKTMASIKQVCSQKFYIGSKDQSSKLKSKLTHNLSKKQLKNRIKSGFNRRIYQIENRQQNSNGSPSKKQSQIHERPKKSKPISAKHPFKRNQALYQTENYKYQQKSTRIQEEGDEDEEELSQFVNDAVPGPGAYQVGQFKQTTKKCMLFTEKNRDRFQTAVNQDRLGYQFNFYDSKPNARRSKSRASQRKVGFGRSMTQKQRAPVPNHEVMQQPIMFYQDNQSLQNKCMKLKLKDALNPGFFTSKVERFPSPDKKILNNTYKAQLKQQQHLQKIKKQFNDHKLTHPFNSLVQREKSPPNLTSNIEYSGQQHKTIENNLRQILSQPKYTYPDKTDNQLQMQLWEQIADNQNQEILKHVKSQIQIKHHLVEDLYGFRQRDRKIGKKEVKGYTFNMNKIDINNKENYPDPTKYHRQLTWVKNNFNMKFQHRNAPPTYQFDQQQYEDNFSLEEAIRIKRI